MRARRAIVFALACLCGGAAVALAAPAGPPSTLLLPGVSYEARSELTRYGPIVYHVITMPRRAAPTASCRRSRAAAFPEQRRCR